MSYKYRIIYKLFILALFLNAMGSYAVAGVPIPWLANVSLFVLAGWVLATSHKKMIPGTPLLATFIFWAIIITIANMLFKNYAILVPSNATTNYFVYIFLRIFNLSVFVATVYLAYWTCMIAGSEKFIRDLMIIATIIGVYSIYVYIAQTNGLPEIPRTRLGTGGEEQNVTFTYAFHRAMGTFREPSHLAEWLVFPLVLSFSYSKLIDRARSFLLVVVLMLTGSLTGISSLFFGGLSASLLSIRNLAQKIKNNTNIIILVFIALFAFNLFVSSNSEKSSGLVDVLWDRIDPILNDSGLKSSNRNYVYEYADEVSFPFLGAGFGNSNLVFTDHLGLKVVASFLNLYLNVGYSLGWVGLFILVLVFIFPVFLFLKQKYTSKSKILTLLFAAYFSWLVIFYVHSEELSIPFALIYALLLFEIKYPKEPKSHAL